MDKEKAINVAKLFVGIKNPLYEAVQEDYLTFLIQHDLGNYLKVIEINAIIKSLEESNHIQTFAADKLGISFKSIRSRIDKYSMDLSKNPVSADYFKHTVGLSLDAFLEVVEKIIIEIERDVKQTDCTETKEARHNEIKETNDNKNSAAVLTDKEEALKIIRMIANGENPFEDEKPAKYLPEHNPKTLRALCNIIASLFPAETEGDFIRTQQPLISGNYLNKPIEQFFKSIERDAILEALINCLLKEDKAAEMLGITNAELQSRIVEHNIDVSELEKKAIFQALTEAEWDISKASELLNISLDKLENKIDGFGIGQEVTIKALLAAVDKQFMKVIGFFPLDEFLMRVEKNAIIKALGKSNNHKNAAAGKLKISFRSLRYRIDKLKLEDSDIIDPLIEIDFFRFYTDFTLDEFLEKVEKKFVELALDEKVYNLNSTAEKLGISFRSLRYRMEKLDIGYEKI